MVQGRNPTQLARMVGVPGRINRRKFLRVRRPLPGNVRDEIITHQRQRLRRQSIKFQILQINVMVRTVEVFQRQIAHVPPAVGLARQKLDAGFQRGRQRESAKIRRQRRQRQFIDGMMSFVIPGPGIQGQPRPSTAATANHHFRYIYSNTFGMRCTPQRNAWLQAEMQKRICSPRR